MVNTGIERAPTDIERKNMSIPNGMTPQKFFAGELAKVEQKFVKEHRPFDAQCAKIDFKDKLDRAILESERSYGYVREEDATNVDIKGLELYGKEDRFEIEVVDEEVEMQNINGIRSSVKVGFTVKYKCKNRGHGCSVFMPTDVYNERFNKTSKGVTSSGN